MKMKRGLRPLHILLPLSSLGVLLCVTHTQHIQRRILEPLLRLVSYWIYSPNTHAKTFAA